MLYTAAFFASLAHDEEWPPEAHIELAAHVVRRELESWSTNSKVRNHWPRPGIVRYLLFLTGLGGEVGVGTAIRDHMGGSLIDRGEVGKEMVSRGDN